jgi:FkbM family methyltransferase
LSQVQLGKGWDSLSISPEIKAIKKLVKEIGLDEIVAFDVGANNGEWALAFLKFFPDSSVYTFEPQQTAFENLKANTATYPRIKNFNFALSDHTGEATLFSDFHGSGMASLSKREISYLGIHFENSEKIQIKTLDSIFESDGISQIPTVLKIDVEGHEIGVLYGAEKTLNSIKIMQIEFGGTCIDTKVFFKDYWALLIKYEFEIFRLTPRGLLSIKNYSEKDEIFRFTNYFAVKRSN